MYARAYDLAELPFELTPDPKYLFLTPGQREALSILQYGLFSAKSITVLIGEAGTGKTMLLQAALESERCRHVQAVYLNNPTLRPDDLPRLLAARLSLGPDAGESKAVFLDRLEQHLCQQHAMGTTTALVVDEAQALRPELLEEIRLLGNIERPGVKLLPLVLAGQPELGERLEDPALRQVKQRVALRCELEPFTANGTAAYIASRIRTAGGDPARLFSREAVTLIDRFSRGIPRIINVICDNALLCGMALGGRMVDHVMVGEVCRDLRLQIPEVVLTPASPAQPDATQPSSVHPDASPSPAPVRDEAPVDLSQSEAVEQPVVRRKRARTGTVARMPRTAAGRASNE